LQKTRIYNASNTICWRSINAQMSLRNAIKERFSF